MNNQLDLSQRFEYFEPKLEGISHTNGIDNMSSLNNMSDCTLPIDNKIDIETFNDKISGESTFFIILVQTQKYFNY